LHRRFFLQGTAAIAAQRDGLGGTRETISAVSPPTMLKPGAAFNGYGMPSHWRENIQRILVMNARRPAPSPAPRARRCKCWKA
jgi:hypothetical protein